MTSVRVAIYARVSSDQQVEGGTIASQLAALQARLAQDGARLEPACRFVDEGYSGATLVRPALERLRDLAPPARRPGLRPLARSPGPQVRLPGAAAGRVPARPGSRSCSSTARSGARRRTSCCCRCRAWWPSTSGPRSWSGAAAASGTPPAAARSACCRGRPTATATSARTRAAGRPATRSSLEEARVVRQVFRWVGQERATIGEVSRRLRQAGEPDAHRQDRLGSRHRLGHAARTRPTPAGAAFGKTRAGPLRPRLRPPRRLRRSRARRRLDDRRPGRVTGRRSRCRPSSTPPCSRPCRSNWRRTGAAPAAAARCAVPPAGARRLRGAAATRSTAGRR